MGSVYGVLSKTSSARTSKIHIAMGTLPGFIDPKQPPTKRAPWRQLQELSFLKSVTMIVSSTLYDQIGPELSKRLAMSNACPSSNSQAQSLTQHTYAKVIMSLADILSNPFYTRYIRTPSINILMLSEGTPGVQNTYCLRNGILRLDLSRQSYERAGLQGQPITTSGGRKHAKEHFRVEINLRAPSMVRGKKGFDRLYRAAKEVLGESRVWLFRDLSPTDTKGIAQQRNEAKEKHTTKEDSNADENPVLKHHPTVVDILPTTFEMEDVLIPPIINTPRQTQFDTSNTTSLPPPPMELQEDYYDLAEWIDLASLRSPRIRSSDNPDPHISRYTVPKSPFSPLPSSTFSTNTFISSTSPSEHDQSQEQNESTDPELTAEPIKILKWTGLLDSKWLIDIIITLTRISRTLAKSSSSSEDQQKQQQSQWIALTVQEHKIDAVGGRDGITILLQSLAREAVHSAPTAAAAAAAVPSNVEVEEEVGDDVMDIDTHPTTLEGDMDISEDVSMNAGVKDTKEKEEKKIEKSGLQQFISFEYFDS